MADRQQGAFDEGLEELVEMKLDLRTPGSEESEAVTKLVEKRLLFALARFEGQIEGVTVDLAHMSGPRRRSETRCHMVARLIPWGAVHVERTAEGLVATISRTADRLGWCVEREVARRGGLKSFGIRAGYAAGERRRLRGFR